MTNSPGAVGTSPVRYSIENPNCMNRFVQWFLDDQTSTALKVSLIVLAALALVGTGLVIANPLVALLVTVLPTALFGLWALSELYVLNRSQVQTASDEEVQSQAPLPEQALIESAASVEIRTELPQTATPVEEVQSQAPLPEHALIESAASVEIQAELPQTATLLERLEWVFGGKEKLAMIRESEDVSDWVEGLFDEDDLQKILQKSSVEIRPAPAQSAPLSEQVAWAFGGENILMQFLEDDPDIELADVKKWLDTTVSEMLADSEEIVPLAPPLEVEPPPAETGLLSEKLAWAFGGEDKLIQFPELHMADNAVWHRIGPESMNAPIMRGVKGGSPFYVLRIQHTHAEYGGEFAIFFYQAVIAGKECWRHAVGGTLYQNPFHYLSLQQKDWELIHQIVVKKNHPQLVLF